MRQKNTVELTEYSGSDLGHGLSAWCSTSRDITEDKLNRLPQFLKSLADDGHTSVFEKSYFRFLINVDTATHVQIIRHRVGFSPSVESARYKELKEDKIHIPEDWKCTVVSEENKREISELYPYANNSKWEDMLNWYSELGNLLYHKALKDLTPVLGRKRAKESARYFKPYSSQVTMDISCNFRSFMHFQGLRNSEHAQKEIRDIAKEMLRLVFETGQFNHSLKAFGYERDLLGKVEKSNHPS